LFWQALARCCHKLERMDLEECILITDASLSQLAAQCPCLESLSLSHCELITDEGIRHLGASPCASESLTVLGTRARFFLHVDDHSCSQLLTVLNDCFRFPQFPEEKKIYYAPESLDLTKNRTSQF